MNNITTKAPPLGVKPGWLCAAQRISELAGAIQRYADEETGPARRYQIRIWEAEIRMQLDIWDKITSMQGLLCNEEGK